MARAARQIALLVAIAGIVASTPRTGRSVESDPGVGASVGRAALIAVDVFPVRFGSLMRTTIGSLFLVPATILSAVVYPFERNPAVFRENAEIYVVEPFAYTFRRPLGRDFGG